ncbi:type IV secretion system protein [Kribbella sp. NPDC051936]|uniref:type IV secretion system protein n=1 Tax=Kribbella sp. NPDC051936 TaxID=3154946 RepID=UPI00341C14AB
MRWQRRTRTALTVLAISLIVSSQVALAADPKQPTAPTGFADLLPAPDLTHGDTRTLFEQYSPMAFSLDFEGSLRDPLRPIFNSFAQLLMMFVVAATRAGISVGWWLFSFTDIRPLMNATSGAIGGISGQLTAWLLPTALAFGAIAAYVHRRSTGTAFGQLVWVFAAGLLAVSLAFGAATWLKGIDGARQVGAQTVMGASQQILGPTLKTPIEMPEPAFPGTSRDTMLRKSGDSAWRGFAATPWCIAEFGSIDACKRYGKGLLDVGVDSDKRMDYINDVVVKGEGSADAPTVKWAKGENAFGRVGVLLVAGVAAAMYAYLIIGLAVTALMAFVGCLVLLVVGVIFACLFIVPGRSRQWGMNWLESLLGLVLQSVAAMLVFGIALSMLTAVFTLSNTLGWLPVTCLALVVLVAAYRLRRLLESVTSSMRPGLGSMVMGSYARRGAVQAVRRVVTALRSRGSAPTPTERPKDGRRQPADANPGDRVETNRNYRTMPPPGGRIPRGDDEQATTPGSRRSPIGRSAGGIGAKRPIDSGSVPGRLGSIALSASQSRLKPGRQDEALRRQTKDTVYVGGTTGSGKANRSPGASTASASRSSGRHARPSTTAAQLRNGGYEPRRTHVQSASLREGPSKRSRAARRQPVSSSRTYREYSAVRSAPVRPSGGR